MVMKYAICFLLSLVLLFTPLLTSAQIIDSDYVREGQSEEVLGVEDENSLEIIEEEEMIEDDFDVNRIIDIFAILGGLVIIALIAYIIYCKKDVEEIEKP
jgi:hypothetical protein